MDPIGAEVRSAIFVTGIAFCLVFETFFPLREPTLPRGRHVFLNFVFAAFGAVLVRVLFLNVIAQVSVWVDVHRVGLLPWLNLPRPLEILLGLFLMDYTFYFWHLANHKSSFLWRFHNVHHTDMDVDVSTAARFHAGELAFSIPFRAVQLVLLGVNPFTWVLFEILVVSVSQFQHANIKLPEKVDRLINWVFVTPRMHGLHHSLVREETDSNYSTLFSFWDRLHGSFTGGRPPFPVGVPSYRDPGALTLWRLFVLPFQQARPWRLPDGRVPSRGAVLIGEAKG